MTGDLFLEVLVMKKTAAVVTLLTFISLPSFSTSAEPAIPIRSIDQQSNTMALLKSIRNSINDAIDMGRSTSNYLLFKSGTELKSIIDTWEKANSSLGDKTYKALDKSQQTFLVGANTAAEKLKQDGTAQKEATTIIAELANQAVADASIFDGKPALFSYAPRIVYPEMGKVMPFKIRGINFNKANPRITLPNGTLVSRVSLSNQEAVFSVPFSAFKFDPLKAGFTKLKLSYLNSKKKPERTDIEVLQLPQKFSDFTLQIKTRDSVQDIWEGTRQFYWSGRDQSKTLSQGPHANGWKIMPSSLSRGRVWGEAGKGCSIASNNEHGFAIEIRLNFVKAGLNPVSSPYQYCEWHWKEYFDRQVINEQPPISGQVNWSKPLALPLPLNTVSTILLIKTWDGIEREITGSQTEPFFQVVDAGDFLEIKPKIPADLNEL